jgi:hypothetical protein
VRNQDLFLHDAQNQPYRPGVDAVLVLVYVRWPRRTCQFAIYIQRERVNEQVPICKLCNGLASGLTNLFSPGLGPTQRNKLHFLRAYLEVEYFLCF